VSLGLLRNGVRDMDRRLRLMTSFTLHASRAFLRPPMPPTKLYTPHFLSSNARHDLHNADFHADPPWYVAWHPGASVISTR
jgi:hypothetical protein